MLDRRVALALALLAFAATLPALADARFYLQQEEVRGPERELAVGVRGASAEIEFTVYRAMNPVPFLAAAGDVHKLGVEGTPLRAALSHAIAVSEEKDKPEVHGPSGASADAAMTFSYVRRVIAKGPWDVESESGEAAPYPSVELGNVGAGLYLVEGREGNLVAYCLAVVSDLALVVRRHEDGALVYAVDRKTGTPRSGVEIQAIRAAKPLASATTRPDGLATLSFAYAPRLLLVGTSADEVAIADPDFYPASVPGVRGYILTDRPLYLPGETVRFAGIVRETDGREYSLPSQWPAAIGFGVLDAQGREVARGNATVAGAGAFDGSFEAPRGSALGLWRLVADVGEGIGTEFRVEEFEKPTFLVDVRADRRAGVAGEKVAFEIEASLYAGGRLPSGTVGWKLFRSRFHQPLFQTTGLASFYSRAEYRSFQAELVTTGEGELAGGRFALEVESEALDHPYHYRLDVSVQDSGRKWAGGSTSVAFYPSPLRLDLAADRELYRVEETVHVTVRAVDVLGEPVETPFEVRAVRRGRKYPLGGHAGFRQPGAFQREREEPETSDELLLSLSGRTQASGEGTIEFPVPQDGEIEVSVAASAQGKSAAASTVVWASAGGEPIPYGGDSVRIVPDRKTYRVGDVARILVLLPMSGVSPLVTVEGQGILSASTEAVPGNSRTIDVPITAAMVPNAFVRVTAVKGGGAAQSVRALVVPPEEKVLAVTVEWEKAEYKPGDEAAATVTVVDSMGRPVETDVVLAVVDESLFALAPDALPSLVPFFHPLRRPNVSGSHSIAFRSYDWARPTDRLPAVELPGDPDRNKDGAGAEFGEEAPDSEENGSGGGGQRNGEGHSGEPAPEPARSEAPGDRPAEGLAEGEEMEKKSEESGPGEGGKTATRSDFQTTALWQAWVRTDGSGRARISFKVPDNLTTWRLTARTVDGETRVGEVRSKVVARLPIMAGVSLPRFLVAGDVTKLVAWGRNATGGTVERLDVSVRDGEAWSKEGGFDEVADGNQVEVHGEYRAQAPGPVLFHVEAAGGGESDAEERTIEVHRHGILTGSSVAGRLADRPTETPAGGLVVPGSADPGSARLVVWITPSYVAAIEQVLPYLAGYPYGCTEQTMSRFGPDLAAVRAFSLLGREEPRAGEELAKMVSAGLSRLYALQHEDGGWGWWENDATHPQMTAYVLEGLLLARELGYPVDGERLSRGLMRLALLVEDPALAYPERAQALSVLARDGKVTADHLDRAFDDEARAEADSLTLAFLLDALVRLERRPEAEHVAKALAERAVRSDDGSAFWGETGATDPHLDAVEITARVLVALVAFDPQHDLARPAADALLAARSGGEWRSTRDSAAAVHALAAYLAARKEVAPERTDVVVRVGHAARTITTTDPALRLSAVIHADDLPPGPVSVAIETERPEGLFYSAHLVWFETGTPIRAASAGFTVSRRYFRLEEKKEGDRIVHTPVPVEETIGPREIVMVELEIASSEPRDFVLVRDALLGSADPLVEDREFAIPGRPEPADPDHREFRTGEAAFFLTRVEAGTTVLRYFFRPTLAGNYHALPASAELMYYPEVRGHSDEIVLEVR